MRFHRFDKTELLLRFVNINLRPRLTVAAFERAFRAPLYLRAQCSQAYSLFKGIK